MTYPAQIFGELFSVQSVLVLIFTFGVGYVVVFWAYRRAKKLQVWHNLSDFDKAMRTFIIGGVTSWLVFVFSNADIMSGDPFKWWHWFLYSAGWILFLIFIPSSTVILQSFLEPPKPKELKVPQPPTRKPLSDKSLSARLSRSDALQSLTFLLAISVMISTGELANHAFNIALIVLLFVLFLAIVWWYKYSEEDWKQKHSARNTRRL